MRAQLDPVDPFKHPTKVKCFFKKFPRRKYKDRRDVGRGCIFSDPPPAIDIINPVGIQLFLHLNQLLLLF